MSKPMVRQKLLSLSYTEQVVAYCFSLGRKGSIIAIVARLHNESLLPPKSMDPIRDMDPIRYIDLTDQSKLAIGCCREKNYKSKLYSHI